MDFSGSKEKGRFLHTQNLHNILENKLLFSIYYNTIYFLCIFLCLSFKISQFFPFFSNLAHRKGAILFARLVTVKSEIKWSLGIRNWCRSHQGCDFSSFIWVLPDAWTLALDSWSCLSPPASAVPHGF